MRGRVTVALLLTIGFYGLALGIAGGLLSIAWLFWVNGHHVNRVTAFCVIGAGIILWSIVPRPERFEPPGPALEPASNPRLFKELNDVASRVGEPMPHEVYLVPDVNAGVRARGAHGGRRSPHHRAAHDLWGGPGLRRLLAQRGRPGPERGVSAAASGRICPVSARAAGGGRHQ